MRTVAVLGALWLAAACSSPPAASPAERATVALFSTLPIYWPESETFGAQLTGDQPAHWARAALEANGELVPLDTLDAPDLAPVTVLVMAQPRPLSPDENVALDEWVRGGGQVLLFADPLLTRESRFAIGDRRRPQDVVLLSPILARWGLELRFDEGQPDRDASVIVEGSRLPLRLYGTFAPVAPSAPSACVLTADDVAADCSIGRGRVIVVADAALLEERFAENGPAVLNALIARLARR